MLNDKLNQCKLKNRVPAALGKIDLRLKTFLMSLKLYWEKASNNINF